MIYKETVLKVVDSSGAKKVRCFQIYKKLPYASVGDIIKVSVISVDPASKIKKGNIYKAVVVQTVSSINRKNGIRLSFNQNAVILIDEKLEPISKRGVDYVAMDIDPKYRVISKGVI